MGKFVVISVAVYLKFFLISGLFVGGKTQNDDESCKTVQAEDGRCVPLTSCPSLHSTFIQIINGTTQNTTSQEFERSFCTDRSLVCCPTSELAETTLTRTSIVDSVKFLLSENCGKTALRDRIVNGDDADLYAWPWIVLLRGREANRIVWFCGGTLLSDRYVLTAAHCLTENREVQIDFVRVGEYDLSQDVDCDDGVCAPRVQDITVEYSVIHPNYGVPCDICNDIALLRLSRPALIRPPFVNSVCLPFRPEPTLGFTNQRIEKGKIYAAGWGSTNPSSQNRPSVLQEVNIPILSNTFCNLLKRKHSDANSAFCAGGGGKDTCKGDSGGPVTAYSSDNTAYLIGITSAGPRQCGSANTLGLYTNVYHYVPWILTNMRL